MAFPLGAKKTWKHARMFDAARKALLNSEHLKKKLFDGERARQGV